VRSPLEQTFRAVLSEKYPEDYSGVTLSMLPLFCFPEGIRLGKELKGFINFNFILTTELGDRFYCNCLTFKENLEQSLKEELGLPPADPVYYEKAICLISKHRYTDEFADCLRHLYRLSMSKHDVPFHRVVSSFVEGLRVPKELGINGMSYSYGGSNITFETNPPYPIVSVLSAPLRKRPSTAPSSSCPSRPSSASSRPFSSKRRSSSSRSPRQCWGSRWRPSWPSSSPSAGSTY
jgi:hypothetical protein